MAERSHYDSYLRSAAWRAKRKAKIKSCGSRCETCKVEQTKGLHIHHVTYVRLGDELLGDLRVLCERCHRAVHDRKKPYKTIWRGSRYIVRVYHKRLYEVWDSRRGRTLGKLKRRDLAIDYARGAEQASRSQA